MRYLTFDEKQLAYIKAKRDGYTPECARCVRKDDEDSNGTGTSGTNSAEKEQQTGRDKTVTCPGGVVLPIPYDGFIPLFDILTTSEVNVSLLNGTTNPANVAGVAGRDYTQPTGGGGAEYVGVIKVFNICEKSPQFFADLLAKAYGLVYSDVVSSANAGTDNHAAVQESAISEVVKTLGSEDKILIIPALQLVVRNASRDAFKSVFPSDYIAARAIALDTGTLLKNAAQATSSQIFTAMTEQAFTVNAAYIANAAVRKNLLFASDDAYHELFGAYKEDFNTSASAIVTDIVVNAAVGSRSAVQTLEDYVAAIEDNADPDALFGPEWRITTKKFNYSPSPSVLEFAAYPDTPMSSGTAMSAGSWLLTAQVQFNAAITSDTINYRYRI